ncbi:MAG TPA: DNA-binding protein [Stenotrophomonas sp.]|nr:DNA-binding protein [Stenotrophomonas sp.]
MNEYEFILKFRLPDPQQDPGKLVGALAKAGCDDATIGIGQPGRIALDFARRAPTALDAVVSAVRAVRRAIPGAELVEASPDLVGLTDVAELMGCSRQNMRKLMTSNPATFPAAVHEGTQSLWHLRSVLDWFDDTQKRSVDQRLVEVSDVTMKLNIANESRRLAGSGVPKDIAALFA